MMMMMIIMMMMMIIMIMMICSNHPKHNITQHTYTPCDKKNTVELTWKWLDVFQSIRNPLDTLKEKRGKTTGTISYTELQDVFACKSIKKINSLEIMCIYIYVHIGSVPPETGSVELCAIYKHVPLKVRGHKFRVHGGIYWQDVSMIASPQNAVSSVRTGDIRHPRHFLKNFTRECRSKGSYFMRKRNLKGHMYEPLISKLLQHLTNHLFELYKIS